jgi:membrane associated rhomboid family serine protease
VNCGAISAQAVVEDEQTRAERRFQDALFSRATPATFALLGVNVAMFALMSIISRGSDDSYSLIAFGAKTNELLRRGEWFRLVTPIFIHAGLMHLLFNSYALYVVGPQVEKLYGSARFLLIYLLAGIGGVAGSYFGQVIMGKSVDAPSVGASGAIFGLFGVLAVFGVRYRRELPPTIRRALSAGVLPVIVINLIIGFSVPFIDNAAHIGGLLTGAVLTLFIPYVAPGRERVSKLGFLVIAICVAVIIYCFAQAFRTGGRYLAIESFINVVPSAQTALNHAFKVSLIDSTAQERNSAASELAAEIEKMRKAHGPDARSDQIRQDFLRIADKQQSLLTAPAREGGNEIDVNYGDYKTWWTQLKSWVETDGSKYGLSWKQDDKDDERAK